MTATQRARTDYVVSGTLLRMEHRRDTGASTALIEMELGLLKADTRDLVMIKHYAVEKPATDNQIGSSVRAFEQALAQLVQMFLADVASVR